jgi:uncharacterized glyoxalase superfamily protein PhnB
MGLRIAWDTEELVKSIHGRWAIPTGHRMSIAFKCESPHDVDLLYKNITENGHHGVKEPWDAFWGQGYGVVNDPDGNLIDLLAPL